MQYAVFDLLLTILDLYWWIVIASFIVSWLVAFDVINTRSSAVYSIRRALGAMTEPVYEPIRRVLPTFGGLDFSPMVVLLALQFLRNLITHTLLVG
jgi:YggT family protein